MNSDRAALLKSVRSRMERFAETQDLSAVLSDRALADATMLLDVTPDITTDLEVAHAVGWLRWCRYLALPTGDDRQDFDAARTLLTPVWRTAPESVPEALRRVLEDDRNPGGDTPESKADQAAMILRKSSPSSQSSDGVSTAIELLRQSLSATPPGDPRRAVRLSNLATALRMRFEQSGSIADLNEAIDAAREAATATPAGYFERSLILANLANALLARFEWTGSIADLDDLVQAAREAVVATPVAHPGRADHLASLSTALRLRFEQSGSIADLNEAIDAARESAAATPGGHLSQADRLSNLATALRMRFESTGYVADLDGSAHAAREAVAVTPDDHPDRAALLSNLGATLQARFEVTGRVSDLEWALDAGRTAASLRTAPPDIRARAARGWASAAVAAGDWDQAVTAYSAAVAQLPSVARRGLGRREQERRLLRLSGLGSQAAAASLQVGQAERAVELFEQGRGVLLGQALDMNGYPHGLNEQHPDLAQRFMGLTEALREDMNAPNTRLIDEPPGNSNLDRDLIVEQRRRLAAEFDNIVAEIRALPGFGEFLLPAGIAQLRSAAANGPVVLVNVDSLRSDALIVSSEQVVTVPLPMLTPHGVSEKLYIFNQAISRSQASDGTRLARLKAEEDLLEVLGWLWDALAEPVLARLGMMDSPGLGQEWPRLWWCPSGPLSFLPLHAAGHHETRHDPQPRTVIDRVVSSYTPTLRMLARAQYESSPSQKMPGESKSLLVAVPNAPGMPDLPGAVEEVRAVRRLLGGDVRELIGNMATSEGLLSALPGSKILHLVCQSAIDMYDPSASQILLYDHQERPLTVLDITTLYLEKAELAFLSTSYTNVSDSGLADEAIHLSSAFQLAGFRQTIGSLWSVADRQSAKLASNFYQALASTSLSDPPAARALHEAVRRQRAIWPNTPSIWACHVHAGI